MKPLRTRLQEARKRLGIPWEVLERDYLLSWILAGIARMDELERTLVFKGGTALKKCYFGDGYRFSEDLDFSALEGAPVGEAMETAVRDACSEAAALLDEYALVEIVAESEDTSHGFHLPDAGIDTQIPARGKGELRLRFEATQPGTYFFECSRPCGAGHNTMRGTIVVED